MPSNDQATPSEDSSLTSSRTSSRSSNDQAIKVTSSTSSSSSSASPSSSSSSSSTAQDSTSVLPPTPSHELFQPQSSLLLPNQTPLQIQLLDSLKQLIESYQALNSSTLTELNTFPDALEFSRDFVGVNRPLVIRSCGMGDGLQDGVQVKALRDWDRDYLVSKLGDRKVQVAVSPDGKADSIVRDPKSGKQYFVEPASIQMNLSNLFDHLNNNPTNPTNPTNPKSESESESEFSTPVYYLQSQNGNLQPNQDLEILLEDVGEKGPDWARRAFGTDPDAVNVWIGDERSETCVHKDPYENIYLVIRGTKTFTLYPPTEFVLLNEKTFPHAQWVFNQSKNEFEIVVVTKTKEGGVRRIPWLTGPERTTKFEKNSSDDDDDKKLSDDDDDDDDFKGIENLSLLPNPIKVVLNQGDYLYLPSLWFHSVRQKGGLKKKKKCDDEVVDRKDGGREGVLGKDTSSSREDRVVIAVNWWYDMKMNGASWSMNEFLRAVSRIAVGDQREEEEEEEEGRV